jgi:xeroderma pigmentosum group C-complementing protein
MPRKKTATSRQTEAKRPRRSRRHATNEGGIPEVYQDMLAEAAASPPSLAKSEGRAAKRRRIEEPPLHNATPELKLSPAEKPEDGIELGADSVPPIRVQQTIYDDFSGSDDSDADFEDVDLEREPEPPDGEAENKKPLQLDLSRPSGLAETTAVQRRKPATTAEKRLRLDVHKWHLLCLMLHGHHRNRWCDNEEVQAILKPLIPRKLITLLHLDESKPQYARNHGFNKAMEEISDIWQREWTITANGLRRAFWVEDADVLRDVSQRLPFSPTPTHQGADRRLRRSR